MFKALAVAAASLAAVAVASPAQAYWVRPYPYVYGYRYDPPVVAVRPPPHWVPAHYTRWGAVIPGHWS